MFKVTAVLAAIVALAAAARADVLFTHPPLPSGTLLTSAYWDPDGSDYDEYVWDAFTLAAAGDITEIRWRGGGSTAITDFEISIWTTIPAGTQPDVGGMFGGRLAHFTVGGTAGQTPAGVFGGVQMYDYHYTLRTPLHLAAGVKYWIQIEGWTAGWPSWGLATGSGGSGTHFHRAIAVTGDYRYFFASGNAAFTLIGTPTACSYPVIAQNPQPVLACAAGGGVVTFSVQATGTGPFTYRWRLNGVPEYDGPGGGGHGGGATISGATTPTLTITQPSYWADAGVYDCIVTNGCGPTTSAGAALTFSNPPLISAGPADAAACAGGSAVFTVTASSVAPITYRWRKNGVALSDGATGGGSIIAGAGTAELVISNAGPGDAGVYTCLLVNQCAPGGITSGPATLSLCAGDFNCDGLVDFGDYLEFLNLYGALDARADLNQDGLVDFADYLEFLGLYDGGC